MKKNDKVISDELKNKIIMEVINITSRFIAGLLQKMEIPSDFIFTLVVHDGDLDRIGTGSSFETADELKAIYQSIMDRESKRFKNVENEENIKMKSTMTH